MPRLVFPEQGPSSVVAATSGQKHESEVVLTRTYQASFSSMKYQHRMRNYLSLSMLTTSLAESDDDDDHGDVADGDHDRIQMLIDRRYRGVALSWLARDLV